MILLYFNDGFFNTNSNSTFEIEVRSHGTYRYGGQALPRLVWGEAVVSELMFSSVANHCYA